MGREKGIRNIGILHGERANDLSGAAARTGECNKI